MNKKEIIKAIMREKYAFKREYKDAELYIVLNQRLYKELWDDYINYWTEKFTGALVAHVAICGIEIVKDFPLNENEEYRIIIKNKT